MANKHVRAEARRLVALLPELPQPWDITVLCEALGRMRGRPVKLHSADLPALPFGMWYDDGRSDHIIHRSSATGYYRDHIVLHEICHMLAGHGTALRDVAAEARAKGKACNDAEEELAETFSSMVLKAAGRMRPKGISPVERRAEDLLGAGRA
ncbi:hypothetical protein GCM10010218_16820 [Streptomyces mashuensis]|uniref:IrrE N-terminal-like domain-containing protein n=1 Tax=Streptomyces mashuensis TaxID=33904 RepID=A0A919B2C8_9ACTN|nr:hypothetical protein [Streptomyces mashuensis]GHF36002.1 hypothetical protein GCM10010218_16820 [Streptomyces mashuensis]